MIKLFTITFKLFGFQQGIDWKTRKKEKLLKRGKIKMLMCNIQSQM
jgi:hypothetical protein